MVSANKLMSLLLAQWSSMSVVGIKGCGQVAFSQRLSYVRAMGEPIMGQRKNEGCWDSYVLGPITMALVGMNALTCSTSTQNGASAVE